METPAQKMLESAPHRNHRLFSDSYLAAMATRLPEWEDDTIFVRARDVRRELAARLAQLQPEMSG